MEASTKLGGMDELASLNTCDQPQHSLGEEELCPCLGATEN